MEALAGLFLAAFLAATLLPFSSEAVLAGVLWQGGQPWWVPWLVATAGNVLGSWSNWLLGRYFSQRVVGWGPFQPLVIARAAERFNRYGHWSLLLAWLPVVGDPLTFVAGLFGVPWLRFILLVTLGKGGRYLLVAWAATPLIS